MSVLPFCLRGLPVPYNTLMLSRILLALSLSALCLAQPSSSVDWTRFSSKSVDTTANACENFYQYACGGWLKANPLPASKSRYGRFTQLYETNMDIMKALLEESGSAQKRSPVEQKIGDYYASCMDEAGIEKAGLDPIKKDLEEIWGVKDIRGAMLATVELQKRGIPALFEFDSQQDFKESTRVIAYLDQVRLGLPDRDYYLKTDERMVKIREQYVAHIEKMFALAQVPDAAAKAKAVLDLETKLAEASLDRVSRRDPNKIYHMLKVSEVEQLSPRIPWGAYLRLRGVKVDSLNVAVPDYFKSLSKLVETTPVDTVKATLAWSLLRSYANALPNAFVNESFDFYGKTLQGAKELEPRWRRCVMSTDGLLGEALGQKFVEKAFGGESKTRMLTLVKDLQVALEQDIKGLDWMSAKTKDRALEKLGAIVNKIGYPEKWRDYGKVRVVKGEYLANVRRAREFERERQLDKIGKPVDKGEWFMSPPTVNAYYDPSNNDINFPAGILQPPFFDVKLDDAVNYGAIGAVIGHELTHGFDDEGRQFDAKGNLMEWWTEEDATKFKEKAACVVDQYSSYTPVEGATVNGKLTLGENLADLGGMRIAYMALMNRIANQKLAPVDGFTPDQRFFLGWAQVWCTHASEEAKRMLVQTDPHSPEEFRVNGVVSNMPEFAAAFSCKPGQKMVRPTSCRVW